MLKNTQLLPVYITTLLIALLPLGNLYAWENFTLFNTALTHRFWIISWEVLGIAFLLGITPLNFISDIKRQPKLAWPILLLCISGFFSCLFSQNMYAALARHSEIILHFAFIYLLSKHASNKIVQNLLIAGLISSFLYTLFHFSLLRLAVGSIEYNWVSNIPFFSNIRHWGYLQVLVLPLSYYLILNSNRRLKFSGYSLFLLTWISIFFSGGRGSLLAGLITCLVLAPLILNLKKNVYFVSILLVLLAAFSAYQVEGNNPSLSIKRLLFITEIEEKSDFDLNRTSSSRIGIYRDSLREVYEHSPIFGMGPDNYRYSLNHQYHVTPTHPHSLPVQFIYEYGLIGTCLMLVFIFNWLKRGVNSTCNLKKSVWLSLLCCLAASLVDGNFYHSYSLFSICLILSILFSSSTPSEPATSRNLAERPTLFTLLLLPALIIWSMHTFTFIQYTSPLTNQNQIDNIKLFPSVVPTNLWVKNGNNSDLYKQAIIHGGTWSDGQCAHYKLLNMLYPVNVKDDVKNNCRKEYKSNDQ